MKKLGFLLIMAAFFVGCGTSTPKQEEAQAPVEEVQIEQSAAEVADTTAQAVEEAAQEVKEVVAE